eukprot:553771_1
MAASTSSTSNVPVLEFIPPFANPIDNVQSEQSNINNNHVGKYCILLRDVTLEEDNEMEIVIGTGQLGQIIIENQTIKVAFTKPHDCRKAILQKGDICIDKAKVKQAAMKVSKLYGLIEDYPFTDGAKRKIKKHRENIKKRRGMAKKQKTDIEYSDDETNETAPVQANLSLPSLNNPIIAETAPVQAKGWNFQNRKQQLNEQTSTTYDVSHLYKNAKSHLKNTNYAYNNSQSKTDAQTLVITKQIDISTSTQYTNPQSEKSAARNTENNYTKPAII